MQTLTVNEQYRDNNPVTAIDALFCIFDGISLAGPPMRLGLACSVHWCWRPGYQGLDHDQIRHLRILLPAVQARMV
jgi:hypothetical protein